MLFTVYLVFISVFLILVVGIVKWKDIYAFFRPEKFLFLYFVNPDNTISKVFHFKKDMSQSNLSIGKNTYFFPNKPDVTFQTGRIKSYFFDRNNAVPLNLLSKQDVSFNPKLINSFIESKTTDLWKSQDRPLDDFIKSYGLYIVVGLVVFVIVYYLFFAKAPTEVIPS